MTCSCGGGHATFGACMRAKNIRIGFCQSAKNFDYTTDRRNQRELDAYRDARMQGVQPAGTGIGQTRAALDMSDALGRPFNATSLTDNFLEP